MAEEATPEETQDTSATDQAAPEGTPAPEPTDGSPAETEDWQERYQNLQPEYTRASQEAAQYRQIFQLASQGDPEAQNWIAEQVGWEVDGQPDDEEEDPTAALAAQVEQLRQADQERQQEARYDAVETDVQGRIEELVKDANLSFENKEHEQAFTTAVFAHLTQHPNGGPDVDGAFKQVTNLMDIAFTSRMAQKRNLSLAPSGSSSTHQPDLDDPEQRRDHWAAIAAARSAGSP